MTALSRSFSPNRSAFGGDLWRGVAGACLCLAPVFLGVRHPISLTILLGLAALFAGYGLRAWDKGRTRYELDPTGVTRMGEPEASLRWLDLDKLDLRYYSTRLDRDGGWMCLSLWSGRRKMTLDSRMGNFEPILNAAIKAAETNQAKLSDTTRANLAALKEKGLL
ncbi:hypothetical protein [Magnetospira sp. QH-2]|uniref:hypothetical protein n=1 Tax=Magnetospira sp. (strain QH-2) TaxID=1288970 RepID=UPI0003E80FC9|nr:hypothetical protein [Magnetospira sp. QH-2]CCQ74919.1 conserved protein of unknown function [Magnetospira sp. QH-2]